MSSGQFERPSETKLCSSGQCECPSKAESGSSGPAKPKRSRAANPKRPSEANQDCERPREDRWARAADSSFPARLSGFGVGNVGRCSDLLDAQRNRSGLERRMWIEAGSKRARAVNVERPSEAERASAAERGPEGLIPSAPAMPSGARGADFEHPNEAERARAPQTS